MNVILGRLNVSLRFVLVLAIGLLVASAVSLKSLSDLRETLQADRATEVRHLVEAATAEVAFWHDRAARGLMPEPEAREAARNAVRAMRYDHGNYFFVWDMQGTSVAHGGNPALEGQRFVGTAEAAKLPFVADMVSKLIEAVRDGGEGFASYRIPKAGQTEPLDKIGFAKLFAPWGWVIGSGAYLDDLDDAFWHLAWRELATIAAMVLAAGAVSLVLARDLSQALRRLSRCIDQVATGNLDGEVPSVGRQDEVGVMARALLVLRDTSREATRLRSEQAAQVQVIQDQAAKGLAIRALADRFEQDLRGMMTLVANGTQQARIEAATMSDATGHANDAAQQVDAATEQTKADVQAAVAATEALSGAVRTIDEKVSHAARQANSAAQQTSHVGDRIHALEEASQKIGDVLSLISDIAGQTNLLALNATIEAARAGDAGRGFAVVASEVKKLAAQTSRATTDIGAQVERIRQATDDAVRAIQGIAGTIGEVNGSAAAVVAAIEAHAAATAAIMHTVLRTAEGARSVSLSTTSMMQTAAQARSSAVALLDTTAGLDQQSRNLQHEVDSFLTRLRA